MALAYVGNSNGTNLEGTHRLLAEANAIWCPPDNRLSWKGIQPRPGELLWLLYARAQPGVPPEFLLLGGGEVVKAPRHLWSAYTSFSVLWGGLDDEDLEPASRRAGYGANPRNTGYLKLSPFGRVALPTSEIRDIGPLPGVVQAGLNRLPDDVTTRLARLWDPHNH